MRALLRAPLAALCCAAPFAAPSAPQDAGSTRTEPERGARVWVASGSSVAGGASWVAFLAEELERAGVGAQVLDRSRPGETLLGTWSGLRAAEASLKGGRVVLEPGLVEAALVSTRGHLSARIPLGLFERMLEELARAARAAEVDLVLVCPPALMWTERLRELFRHGPLDTSERFGLDVLLRPYARAVRECGRRHGLTVVDLHWHLRQATRAHGVEPEHWSTGAARWSERGARGAARLVAAALLGREAGARALAAHSPWLELSSDAPTEVDRRVMVVLDAASIVSWWNEESAEEELLASFALSPTEFLSAWPVQLVRSLDQGASFGRRLPTPANWRSPKGPSWLLAPGERTGRSLWLAVRGEPPLVARSHDGGRTWTPLEPFLPPAGDFSRLAPPTAIEAGEGEELVLYGHGLHARDARTRPWVVRSLDGGASWSVPRALAEGAWPGLAEPVLVRSRENGRRALVLGSRPAGRAWLLVEEGEGRWSEPRPLASELAGEGHVGAVLADGRVALAFRDTVAGSRTAGDWMLWLGTFEDLERGREGELRARIAKEHEPRVEARGGLVRLRDGRFVVLRAGRWIPDQAPYVIARVLEPAELERRLERER